METLKLYGLCIVDHCRQIRMDVSGSTYIFIRRHPCLFVFHSHQALWSTMKGIHVLRTQVRQKPATDVLAKDDLHAQTERERPFLPPFCYRIILKAPVYGACLVQSGVRRARDSWSQGPKIEPHVGPGTYFKKKKKKGSCHHSL